MVKGSLNLGSESDGQRCLPRAVRKVGIQQHHIADNADEADAGQDVGKLPDAAQSRRPEPDAETATTSGPDGRRRSTIETDSCHLSSMRSPGAYLPKLPPSIRRPSHVSGGAGQMDSALPYNPRCGERGRKGRVGFSDKQRVMGAPSLPTSNRYGVLSIEDVDSKFDQPMEQSEVAKDVPKSKNPYIRKKRWERRLPKKFVISSTPSELSLKLNVEVKSTETGIKRAIKL